LSPGTVPDLSLCLTPEILLDSDQSSQRTEEEMEFVEQSMYKYDIVMRAFQEKGDRSLVPY